MLFVIRLVDTEAINYTVWPVKVSDMTLQEIGKSGRKSNVKFMESDGGGNMGTIEVFHQLHCLVRIARYVAGPIYF